MLLKDGLNKMCVINWAGYMQKTGKHWNIIYEYKSEITSKGIN